MAAVTVDITASSGSATPTISVYLQGTIDGGTTWTDIPADKRLVNTTPGTAEPTVDSDKRNIVPANTASTARWTAIYKHLPYAAVRLAWAITGTTPSFTFSAVLSGK